MITQVSTIKLSKKNQSFYHGFVSDGGKSLKLVGFNFDHQKRLLDHCDRKKS